MGKKNWGECWKTSYIAFFSYQVAQLVIVWRINLLLLILAVQGRLSYVDQMEATTVSVYNIYSKLLIIYDESYLQIPWIVH